MDFSQVLLRLRGKNVDISFVNAVTLLNAIITDIFVDYILVLDEDGNKVIIRNDHIVFVRLNP